jgi:sigma-B regulation protein RsbU (phosphoserine phosphatase)
MRFVDLSNSSSMSRLIELTRAISNCETPYDALLEYSGYLGDTFPNRAQLVLSTRGLASGQYRVWRLLDDSGREHAELTDPWTNLIAPVLSGGVLAQIIKNRSPHLVYDLDWTSDPHFAHLLSPYRALIAVPFFNERVPLDWSIMLTRDPDRFNVTDLEFSVSRAALIGSLIDSLYVGSELVKAHAHINEELDRMARIQRALLPEPLPQIPGLSLAASYQTFTQVGGDLYDLFPIDDTEDGRPSKRWVIFIGDASGHGPSAAVAAAMVQATLRACSAVGSTPGQLLSVLNTHLCAKRIEGSFVTAFVAFYDPQTRRLTYSTAGHPPPLIPSCNGEPPRQLDRTSGLPLGIEPDAAFEHAVIQFQPGETLLLYTDGITESRSPDGTMFGRNGLDSALCGHRSAAQDVVRQLQEALSRHQGRRAPADDQTALVLQCH